MIGFLKNNNAKIKWLLENVYYPENFDKYYIGKMNLESNDIIEKTKQGTFPDYLNYIKEKPSPKISDTSIILKPKDKSLQILFWYNTACLDTSNFQSGVLDRSYLKNLENEINKFDPRNGKIVVFMAGNLIGKEWELKHLINAANKICANGKNNDSNQNEIRRIYYGLKKRKQKIINDIRFALKCGAEEVYLMKGIEEFNVFKKTGIDVIKEISDKFNSDQVHEFNNVNYFDKDSKVKYIDEGTTTSINLIKINTNGSYYNNIIKIQNIKPSTSENPSVMENKKRYLFEEEPDASFVCGGNFTAEIKNRNEFFPSGQLMYLNTSKGEKPKFMTNDGNSFIIYPEMNHCLTIVKGGKNLYEPNLELIMKIYNERKKTKVLGDLIKKEIDQSSAKLRSRSIELPKISKKTDHKKESNGREQ